MRMRTVCGIRLPVELGKRGVKVLGVGRGQSGGLVVEWTNTREGGGKEGDSNEVGGE